MVVDSAVVSYYFPTGRAPSGRPLGTSDLTPLGSPDGRFGTDLNGVRVLEGRVPRGDDQIAVTFLAGERLGVGVGGTLELQLSGPLAAAASDPGATRPEPFRVVGVVAMQGGFPPLTGGAPPAGPALPGLRPRATCSTTPGSYGWNWDVQLGDGSPA